VVDNVTGGGSATLDQNGQVEILAIPPDLISELDVSPSPVAFGTVDLGVMPQTMTLTAENIGGSNSSLTISGAPYSGDAQFSVTTDGCTGTTLNFGDTCDMIVEFNAAANGPYSGQIDFASDADTNPHPTVNVTGTADSVPNLTANPAFGNLNFGTGTAGSTVNDSAVFSNTGSAPGDFNCTLTDPDGVFTVSPLTGTIAAGDSETLAMSCDLPSGAADGDSFSGQLDCAGDITGTYELSCAVLAWEPLPVPTNSKWGLVVLTLMMLMVGGLSIRFFRA